MKHADPETAIRGTGQDAVAVNKRTIANIFELKHSDLLRLHARDASQHVNVHEDRSREVAAAVEEIQAPRCAFENTLISVTRDVKRDSLGL